MARPSGIKILVIETDETYRRNLAERVRLEGYRVYEACREAEAQQIIEKKKVDVVLLGFAGDKQRGLALLRAIRQLHPCPEVILLTFADEHSLAASIEGMKLGAFDELLVPFNVDTLLRRIQEAWQRKVKCEEAGRKSRETGEGPGSPGGGPIRDGQDSVGKKRGS
ncbi:MAG: response regulator [Syntrophobacteraceae bacterium]